ncbi:MAG: hypothetical protein A3K18_17650 [Lentisphaerae bacterium RIFOXYA12_64_32]|nr:MAG: hypothetical protein A3K18_17650 [Lentisphaerae bacterium RIFOXYA12_64_32]
MGFVKFIRSELRPKGRLLTPFNIITVPIIVVAAVLVVIRFALGLGTVSNLNQGTPWGLWIGFNVVTGVAFAGGAYVVTFMVYILRAEKYHPIVRATVLNGFLAYVFYAGDLLLDLGRPWNVCNPIIGNSFGFSSVLFLVAWHFMLYMIAEFLEFSPAIAEWLGLERIKRVLSGLTLGAVILGIALSTLHQSGLGALFLMAKPKIHPLWYSEFIPILFVVSSVFAGLSMVIFEGSLSQKVFAYQLSHNDEKQHHEIMFGLARICGLAMFSYLFLVVITFVHGKDWQFLNGKMGVWWLVEIVGFVLVPMLIFMVAAGKRNARWVQVAAVMTIIGIILNRLNISVIAFKWYEPHHYVPSWMEVVISVAVISAEIWVFRWIVHRMPVLQARPAWQRQQVASRSHESRKTDR